MIEIVVKKRGISVVHLAFCVPKGCSNHHFYHSHNDWGNWDPRLQYNAMVHRNLHVRKPHVEEQIGRLKTGFISQSFPSCLKFRTRHSQTPTSRWYTATFCALSISLLALRQLYSCIRRSSVPAGQSSWLSAFTEDGCSASPAHQNPPSHETQHWWIIWHLLDFIHGLTVSLYICCQILSRQEKHFPVFILQPLHETILLDFHIFSHATWLWHKHDKGQP